MKEEWGDTAVRSSGAPLADTGTATHSLCGPNDDPSSPSKEEEEEKESKRVAGGEGYIGGERRVPNPNPSCGSFCQARS